MNEQLSGGPVGASLEFVLINQAEVVLCIFRHFLSQETPSVEDKEQEETKTLKRVHDINNKVVQKVAVLWNTIDQDVVPNKPEHVRESEEAQNQEKSSLFSLELVLFFAELPVLCIDLLNQKEVCQEHKEECNQEEIPNQIMKAIEKSIIFNIIDIILK